jgi:hypothetical protein
MSQIYYTKEEVWDRLKNGAVCSSRSGQSVWWSLQYPDGAHETLHADMMMKGVLEHIHVERIPEDPILYTGNWRWNPNKRTIH